MSHPRRSPLAPAALAATFLFAPLALGQARPQVPSRPPADAGVAPPAAKRLDGKFDDWVKLDRSTSAKDPTGDAGDDPTPGSDLTLLALDADGRRLHIHFTVAKAATLQGLDRPLVVLIDADGDATTGVAKDATAAWLPGADLAIVFSPTPEGGRGGRQGRPAAAEGYEIRRLGPDGRFGEALPGESLGFGMAPTAASDRFELRLERGGEFLLGGETRARIVTLRGDEAADLTPVVRCPLPAFDATPRPLAPASAVARPRDTDARILSWNAERDAIMKNPEPFAATLAALAPDVVLLQELGGNTTAESLAAWFDERLPRDTPWRAIVSGGDLRCAVVSPFPLDTASFLDGLSRETDRGSRPVRVAAARVTIGEKTLLALSLHLKCCGRLDSDEDRTRMAEAKAIADAVAKSLAREPADGVAIGGDFNLVGSAKVLAEVAAKSDIDRTDLAVAEMYQLDGDSNQTWRSKGNRFAPGRLDFLLVSDAGLERRGSFVFSEEDLSDAARAELKLPPSVFREPSDHQPVVIDVAFRKR